MFGHVAGRARRSRWAILSFLFALASVWSFAVMGDRGGFWNLLRLGLAVGLGISLLRLVLTFVSSRSLRGAQEDDEWRAKADERAEPPSEERPRTYEEIFHVQANVDGESLAGAPEDEEWQAEQAEDEWQAEGDEGTEDEGTEMEAEGQPPVEEPPTEEPPTEEPASTSEEDLQALQPDSDEAVDQVEALEADLEPQDSLRRMREEFKARAKEAELRVKQREAELHEAASAPESKQ